MSDLLVDKNLASTELLDTTLVSERIIVIGENSCFVRTFLKNVTKVLKKFKILRLELVLEIVSVALFFDSTSIEIRSDGISEAN